ncbi:MAG: hypothetical protein AABW48_04700 [Nanoarchaeota archaeon]
MSLVHNIVGTGLLVGGGIAGFAGLAQSCNYSADYEPLLYAQIECNRGLNSKPYCDKTQLQVAEQNKKVASWAGLGLAGLALAYAGYKIRERGSPSQ